MNGAPISFGILGPLEVESKLGPVPIRGMRRKAVLAALLMEGGRSLPVGRLLNAVWEEPPPASAVANLRTYVHDLRGAFRAAGDTSGRLVSYGSGYRLAIGPTELDYVRFSALAAEGHRRFREGDFEAAVDQLSRALDLWRGRPLEDLQAGPHLLAKRLSLDEERWAVMTTWIDARLAIGETVSLVPQLWELVTERPLYERAWSQLVLALDASGRIGEALLAYRRAREIFVDQLGIEPGADLQRIHAEILNGRRVTWNRRQAFLLGS